MRSRRLAITRAPVVALLAMVLAACQPLPQPFQPTASKKTANPLLKLPDRSGVLVRPVQGMPEDLGMALASEMATALINRNLPSFTEVANPSSLVLTGQAVAAPRPGNSNQIQVIWRISDRTGIRRGEYIYNLTTDNNDWTDANSALLRAIAQKSAVKIAEIVQGPAERDRTANQVQRTLHVWKIDGAPEPAAALLRQELETALRRRALRVSSKMRDDSVIVLGTITLAPELKGQRQLGLEWAVMSPDGRSLGKLQQKNAVTADALENDWPKIARVIAVGAAEGIGDVLEKIPENAVSDAPADPTPRSR